MKKLKKTPPPVKDVIIEASPYDICHALEVSAQMGYVDIKEVIKEEYYLECIEDSKGENKTCWCGKYSNGKIKE